MQCTLYMTSKNKQFQEEEKRVLFILSYLRGPAQAWFEEGLMLDWDHCPWRTSIEKFIAKLSENFSPTDPINDTATGITMIQMATKERLHFFLLRFNQYAHTIW